MFTCFVRHNCCVEIPRSILYSIRQKVVRKQKNILHRQHGDDMRLADISVYFTLCGCQHANIWIVIQLLFKGWKSSRKILFSSPHLVHSYAFYGLENRGPIVTDIPASSHNVGYACMYCILYSRVGQFFRMQNYSVW